MQNGKDFFFYCNVFEYIQDFEQVFEKSDDAFLVYKVSDSIVYLYEIDYHNFLL